MEHYPLQATADRIPHFPASGMEDRIPSQFARYIDQVQDRSLICDGDGVSDECTTKCAPGDAVVMDIGPALGWVLGAKRHAPLHLGCLGLPFLEIRRQTPIPLRPHRRKCALAIALCIVPMPASQAELSACRL